MKRAVPLPLKIPPLVAEELLNRVIPTLLESDFGRKILYEPISQYGLVEDQDIPEWLNKEVEEYLVCHGESLGFVTRSNSSNVWSKRVSLVFGLGSIPTHVDNMSGLSLLTFLGGFPLPGQDKVPSFLHNEGEFYSGGRCITLKPGESLVFDDREPHAWMHNSCWAFVCLQLKKFNSRSMGHNGI